MNKTSAKRFLARNAWKLKQAEMFGKETSLTRNAIKARQALHKFPHLFKKFEL